MGAHAGGLDDAAEGFLTPAAAGLVGLEDGAELLGFVGEDLALGGEAFDLFFDFAERGGLGGFGLLEAFLVGVELLFERFDERSDGLLALGEVAFGGFVEFGDGFGDALDEMGLEFAQGIDAEGFKGRPEIGEGFFLGLAGFEEGAFMESALFGEEVFGSLLAGLSGGERGGGLGDLVAGLREGGIALGQLLAQLFSEAIVGGRGAATGEEPAEESAEGPADGEADQEIGGCAHGMGGCLGPAAGLEVGDHFDFDVSAFGEPRDLDGGASREIGSEKGAVDLVHGGEVGEIGQENGAFDHVGEGEALVVEDGFNVQEDTFGLSRDVAGDEVASGGVERDLAGTKEEVTDADGVVVGTDSGGGLGRFDDDFLRHNSVF